MKRLLKQPEKAVAKAETKIPEVDQKAGDEYQRGQRAF